MKTAYETLFNGQTYRVEMECDSPEMQGLWLQAAPHTGIIAPSTQAPWVTAPRVEHLPSR